MGLNLYHCECQECGDIWEKQYYEIIEDAGVDCRVCYSDDVTVTKVTKDINIKIKELVNE